MNYGIDTHAISLPCRPAAMAWTVIARGSCFSLVRSPSSRHHAWTPCTVNYQWSSSRPGKTYVPRAFWSAPGARSPPITPPPTRCLRCGIGLHRCVCECVLSRTGYCAHKFYFCLFGRTYGSGQNDVGVWYMNVQYYHMKSLFYVG